MNERQRYAYEHPRLRHNPFSTTRDHIRIEDIGGLRIESGLILNGTTDGERPSWWVSVCARQYGANMYRLEHLSAAERLVLRRHAHSLLVGVGMDPPTLVGGRWTYDLFKDCTDEEIAGLPEEAKTVRPFKVKVAQEGSKS
jgi:hypothetical protein